MFFFSPGGAQVESHGWSGASRAIRGYVVLSQLNRGSGVGAYAPCRGLMFSQLVTPDCAPTADAVCATSGLSTHQPCRAFRRKKIEHTQASCSYEQMKNDLERDPYCWAQSRL